MRTTDGLLFVVGARPNFIKIAPLCSVLCRERSIPFKIVHTGQHYDDLMSDIFFQELGIPKPEFYLKVGSSSHGEQTGKMMTELEKLCMEHNFSALIVIGDVNSTLAGALVGSKLNIPVAHVESGLRSFNRTMPEEINRIATDHISDLLFAPTEMAMINLQREGLQDRSHFSGDVMYDMILLGLELAQRQSRILEQFDLGPEAYYLATLHRPYNVDQPEQLKEIITGLSRLDKPVILPAHPRLKKQLYQFGITVGENIHISDPLGYLDFIILENNAKKIITDSGGVQKEAFFLGVPCITLRPETEWVETIETGANLLVKNLTARAIRDAVAQHQVPRFEDRPYGDGRASDIILRKLEEQYFGGHS